MTGTPARKFEPVTLLAVDLDVGGKRLPVGRLAWRDRAIYFAYDKAFLATGLQLSPFNLPLTPDLVEGPPVFDRLHGLFNDSLPDGWGRLLMDRKLREVGLQPGQLTPLDRLAWVGRHGMGALVYRPEHPTLHRASDPVTDLDRLSGQSRLVLEDSPKAVFDELLKLGGSPHGARPKALIGVSMDQGRLIHGVDDIPPEYEHWIVKFRAPSDPIDVGAIEHAYAEMARQAGVDMPSTTLFAAKEGPGYFGIKRFDRVGNGRVHMHTIGGLLHADHTLPSLGYAALLKATGLLTRRQVDVEQMFARMVFNVLAHNRDDHPKNHSFLMDEDGTWSVSPAYDIMFSAGPAGEHALDVAGEGRAPGIPHIRKVAEDAGIRESMVSAMVERVKEAVRGWPQFASNSGVSKSIASEIDRKINGGRKSPGRRGRHML